MASADSGSGGCIELVAAALSAMTNTEIVTKVEYYAREKRARSGVGQSYVFKGSLDVPRAIEYTYAATEELFTQRSPPVRSAKPIKLLVREEIASLPQQPRNLIPVPKNDSTEHKTGSVGFWGSLLTAGSAVAGAMGGAVVVATAPVSVPLLVGSAIVVGGGVVGSAASKKIIKNINSNTSNMPKSIDRNQRSAVQLIASSSDGRERFLTMPSEEDTILQLKLRIREVFGIEPEDQCLSFHGILLDDTDTLVHYSITNNSLIKLSVRVRGGSVDLFYLDDKYLDSRWDYDFTNIDDGDTEFMRGGHRYHRSCGWNRIAIKVLKKYPDGEAWLGMNGSAGEWAVTYHGTTKGAFNSICKEGFWIGDRNAYGRGVYSASHIEIAEGYATMFSHGGIMYKGIFQNRVNPEDMVIPDEEPDYRICPNEASIRPYGLCVKKV